MKWCLGGMSTPSNAGLARYVSGECSDDEARAVAEWAAQNVAHQVLLNEVQALWAARQPLPAWDVSGMWAQVQHSMDVGAQGSAAGWPTSRREGYRRYYRGVAIAVAASLFLIVGVGVFRARESGRQAAASMSMREYVTPRGQRATLQLADGTRVVLAPDSRLRIPETFGRAAREVLLEGEAFFDVVHDSTLPFRVRAKYAIAEDLGTRFDVCAYAEDSLVTVAVAEGAVALGKADTAAVGTAQGVVLTEGERGTLGHTGRVTTTRGPEVAAYLRWTGGTLVFMDAPLSEVVVRLSRWYNLDVRLAPSVPAARRVTATFTSESALEALQFTASILDLLVVQAGDRYTLRAKK